MSLYYTAMQRQNTVSTHFVNVKLGLKSGFKYQIEIFPLTFSVGLVTAFAFVGQHNHQRKYWRACEHLVFAQFSNMAKLSSHIRV